MRFIWTDSRRVYDTVCDTIMWHISIDQEMVIDVYRYLIGILSQRQKTPRGVIIIIKWVNLIMIMAEARYERLLEQVSLDYGLWLCMDAYIGQPWDNRCCPDDLNCDSVLHSKTGKVTQFHLPFMKSIMGRCNGQMEQWMSHPSKCQQKKKSTASTNMHRLIISPQTMQIKPK